MTGPRLSLMAFLEAQRADATRIGRPLPPPNTLAPAPRQYGVMPESSSDKVKRGINTGADLASDLASMVPVAQVARSVKHMGQRYGEGASAGELAPEAMLTAAMLALPGGGLRTAAKVARPAASAAKSSLQRALSNERGHIGPLYHGSPHKFDRFDSSKMGSGEVAQSFGRGTYLAENRKVAQDYRESLGGATVGGKPWDDLDPAHHAARALAKRGGDRVGASADLAEALATVDPVRDGGFYQRLSRAKGMVDRGEVVPEAQMGALYTTELPHASPDDFLIWDKTIEQQPPRVQKTLRSLGAKDGEVAGDVFQRLRRDGDPELSLREDGVRGIKYLDQGSRKKGSGTHNYVVFDDADIAITGREGKAALGMMAGAGAAAGGALAATGKKKKP